MHICEWSIWYLEMMNEVNKSEALFYKFMAWFMTGLYSPLDSPGLQILLFTAIMT